MQNSSAWTATGGEIWQAQLTREGMPARRRRADGVAESQSSSIWSADARPTNQRAHALPGDQWAWAGRCHTLDPHLIDPSQASLPQSFRVAFPCAPR